MKVVCLDAKTLGDVDLSVFNQFGEFVCYQTTKPDETIARLKDADVVITNKVLITKDVIDACALKLICITATGTNNVDMAYAKEKSIPVKNVAGYSTNSVTQQTFASILAVLNEVKFYDDYVQSGGWAKSDIFVNLDRSIYEISGKKFGIIGLGEIGRNVANVAVAFGASVCYYSPSGNTQDVPYARVELEQMLKECDIISIHAPLNDKTKGLIGSGEFAKMKNGAILANFGRGGIVDEKALADAIDSKNIKACIDVLVSEPMNADNPLLNIKNKSNLIITPHIAWGSYEARVRLIEKVVINIKDFIDGK